VRAVVGKTSLSVSPLISIRGRACVSARRNVNFVNFRDLDSAGGESYLRSIPIHRLTGGAFVRASAFRLEPGIF
jgi:hypothetical protein